MFYSLDLGDVHGKYRYQIFEQDKVLHYRALAANKNQ